MRKKGSEIWVGVFVVIGILLLVLMTLKIEKFQFGKEAGYPLSISFSSAPGVDRSSPVRVAGVHVGNVERVVLEEGKAKVTFRLPLNVILYKDAKAYLKSEGFLGEKYVEISPGTPGYSKVEPNGMIEQGAPPADVEQFLSNMSTIREDLREVIKPLGDVLKAVDAKKIEGTIDNLNKFSGRLDSIAGDSKIAFQKGIEAFSRLEEIGDEMRRGKGTLGKLMTDDSIYRDAKKTVEILKDVSEKVNRGEGTLGKLINDEGVYREAKKTIEMAKEALETVKETAESLKNVSEKIEQGKGTLGKLIKDESLYQEAKETVESTKKTMQSAKEAIQSIKVITEKVEKGEGTLGKLVNDDTLVKETEKTLKKIQKSADSIQEQTPITVLGTILGILF